MAEEAKGQRFSQRAGGFLDKITGSQGAQQTQQTQQQTSGQQSTGGVFLPGISNNQNLINSNKVSMNNGFTQGIQDGTIKSNIVLPGITSKPNEATLDTTTMKQKRQSYIYANNNNINTKSINEQIEEEKTGSNKVLGQTGKILKTYREAPINNFKKRGMRAIADSGLPGYFVDKTLEKAGAPDGLGDSIKDAVNETARKVALTYQNKINEDFQKKVDKNIDARIREKYDNESITDLIGKGDGAGARYKIWKGTVENWNMIPEIGLMFVNPYVGLTAMGTDVYIQENQGTFEDMLQNGATYEQAKNGAVAVGILNAGIELFMERFLGGAKWAGATALRRLFLKNAQREVVKQATKKGMAEIFARGVGERLKGSMVEGFEEVLQQITGNIMVKLINPDRDILDGARESFEGGFYNLFNGIGGATNIVNEFKQNEQIQRNADIEALKYVAEGEQRKAQRMAREKARARFLERVKNPAMDNGYTPTEEQAQQREQEKIENEEYEQELQDKYDEETRIEQDMMNEVLSEGDLNEDLGDPRYQKSGSPQSVNEDTVSERSHAGNVRISPENSSEITKSLDEIKKNLNDLRADTFLQQIKKSISGAEGSNYITNKINGKNYVLRVANHHANANNSIRHPKRNTSIVIKLMKRGDDGKNIRFKKNKNVDLVEFVYNPENITPEIMQGIIDGIQNWIQTGEYTDTHYDDMKQSTRTKGQKTTEGKLQKNGEEEYKPGVAKKSEKNISGKEGLNLRNKLNKETVKQLAEKYGIKTEVIEGMIKILEKGKVEGYAYGKYLDQLLTLSEQIKESTAPHELLHAIFDMIDSETKTYLISQVMASEGWTAEQSEEWLADSFSNFFRTGKIENAPKSTRGKIKIFFKKVRSFINGMNKWRKGLEQIFTDILEANGIEDLQGRINRNENLQKAKEKMRKRFMEYEKNVEKVKKKEDNGKYQTVYHGGPNEFDRFDHLHMGEGEGHQAHGRGHYVAVDPKTARNYAENFSRYKGGTIHIDSLSTDEDLVAYKVLSNLQMGMSLEDSMEDVKSYYRDEKKFYENAYKEDKIDRFKELAERSGRLIKAVDKLNKSDFNTKRNFYEVEIPDPVKANTPTGSNYLEEKGEFTEKQLNNFKKILEKYNLPHTNKWLNEGHIKNGEDLYSALSEDFISDAGASKFLEKMGYDGIHYFGGRDGEAYVIFNDDILEIKNHEKYQKAEDNDGRKLSEGQIEYFKDSKVRDENGNLLRVYHGTRNEFTVFAGGDKNRSNSDARIGNWFTPSEKGAKEWAEQSWGSKGETKAMGGYLNITNPKIYENWDATEHLKKTEEKRTKYIKDVNKFLDDTGYNPLKETYLKSYFEKGKDEQYENQNRYSQRKAIEDTLRELSYIQGTYNLDDLMYMYGSERRKFVEKMREKGLSDVKIKEVSKEASERLKKWKDIEIEFRKADFTDAYELFENDLHSFGGQTVDDRVGGGWMAMNNADEAIKAYRQSLIDQGYDGIIIKDTEYDGEVFGKTNTQYVSFYSNQFKNIDNLNPTDNEDIRYQRVYHGSPAEFDRFDSSHMGEGEGGQAHGWGHYVAVDENTGRHYADMRHYDNEVEIQGRTITNPEDLWDVSYFVRELYRDIFRKFSMSYDEFTQEALDEIIDRKRTDYNNVIEYMQNLIDNPEKPLVKDVNMDSITEERKAQLEGYKDALEKLEELSIEDIKVRPTSIKRNLYEVEIPDLIKKDTPTGKNYLEEDDYLEMEEVQKFIKELKDWNYKTGKELEDSLIYEDNGEWYFNTQENGKGLYRRLENLLGSDKNASEFLSFIGYDGIHYFGGRDGEAYVIFDDNDLEIKNHEKYQKVEYEYDENGNPKRIKFGEDNEFDPSIFGENTREEQIEEDKENEKGNPFYNAWMRYNNQNYKDDQKTFEEFMKGLSDRADKEQEIYDEKMKSLSDAQNDPQLLDLQLKAVKLMEEEGNVGKKFGKNVSKEVRDRQQKEVESKREQLISDIVDYMYPGLKTEEITYDMQKEADQKEAEREMLGREDIESKLKYFKKDKNGNREAKDIKVENPDIKLEKLLSAGKFDEIFEPTDRVLKWKTPQGQHGTLDSVKDPKKFKSVMEKINSGKTKTKVELKDVTQEARAYEKQKAMEEAEKERKKKEQQEAKAKKKQEEYKKMVRMKAFQRLVDMQRFEKYPFLTEEEIKNRYGFSDEEWKTITEQEEIKLPKKRGEKAISDFNKAVYDQVRAIRDGLERQNKMKMKDAEKNLGEIGEIDLDVLLGKDEEKGAREVEEFEKLAKEGKEETGGEKIEEGKTAWEKDMDKKNEKAKKQAEKLTKKWKEDVNDMFRKAEEKRNERYANKEEKVIDEVKTVEEAKEITKESRWKKAKNWIKETTIQDLIQPISSRIEQISPRIYLEMMRFEQNISVKTNIRMKQIEDFVKKMSEIRSKNKKDYINITLHLLNGNVGTANQMLEKYGTSIPRQVLDEIWADAEDVGYTMNYEGFYYPRKVKDVKEFLDRFAKVENKNVQSEIEKIIKKKREQAQKRGEEFTKQQEADLINQLLMDGEVEGITLGSGHMKQRKVDNITKNMLEFYEDPVDALLQYITGMTEAIEKARFLGQGKRGEIKTLGEFIADEGIQGWDAEELRKLLLARFNYAPMSKGVAGLKNIANIIHLGSPSSALSQLADISFSLIENGLTNIVQGLAGKYNLDLDALGVTNRGEELKSQGKNETAMDKIQRFTFKMTGFNMMDQFGKKTLVVSTLNKLIKYAKNNDPQLRKDLSRRFDDPKMIDGVIEDLKVGKMSENVNLFLFTKLADVQPLTRMQMPKTYLTSGNGRIFYQFKTFAVKQLDYLIQKGKRDLKTKGTAKGLRSIVVMMGIIMLCGAGTDELKDFSMGRKYSSWIWRMINDDDWSVAMLSDRFWDNLLKLTGLTKYSIYQARTQGIKSTVEDLFFSVSGLDILTYPMQDIQDAFSEDGLDFSQASSWQLIPIVGKYGYRWVGAGQTKQQKKLDKEKKKSKGKGKAKI